MLPQLRRTYSMEVMQEAIKGSTVGDCALGLDGIAKPLWHATILNERATIYSTATLVSIEDMMHQPVFQPQVASCAATTNESHGNAALLGVSACSNVGAKPAGRRSRMPMVLASPP